MILSKNDNSNIEYIIYTSNDFYEQADIIKNLYLEEVDNSMQLETQIIYSENISSENLSAYLYNIENGYVNSNDVFEKLKYLLIIGDETIIEPIYYFGHTPADDYFASKNQNTNSIPTPQLAIGRILINNPESFEHINSIRNYVLYPEQGDWKSRLLLLADDQYKSGKTVREEKWHTIHSNVIYSELKNNLNIACLYGMDYERQQSIDWYTHPELTEKIINKINQGLGLINYIGHGTSEVIADEDILSLSNLDQISIQSNKLPIWIVGTCSFGNYINENCFAEQLLKKGDAGIAVISTTGGVSYQANFNYLKDFFINNLKESINDEFDEKRLGDIFLESKDAIISSYTFHLFGDPAMPLIFPKYNESLITDNANDINIGSFNTININEIGNSFVKINNEDNEITHIYEYCAGCSDYDTNDSCYTFPNIYNCDTGDTIKYYNRGNVLFEGSTLSNSLEYIIPIDVNENNKAEIKIYNEPTNTLETISNLNMILNQNTESNDYSGPNIDIFQNNRLLTAESNLYPPYNISILIQDNLPINLSGINYHNIRIWIDGNQSTGEIINDSFNYCTQNEDFFSLCDKCEQNWCGYIPNYQIDTDSIFPQSHTIEIEAWDIFNNYGSLSFELNFHNNENIFNVYNFPNPFNEKTFFTFGYSGYSNIDACIKIYSLNGKKIKTINEENLEEINPNFYRMPLNGWDGKDENGEKLANGTYIYSLEISSGNNVMHENIYKLTILK